MAKDRVRKSDGLAAPDRRDWLSHPVRSWRVRKARARLIGLRELGRERVGELVGQPGTAALLRDVRDPEGMVERRRTA